MATHNSKSDLPLANLHQNCNFYAIRTNKTVVFGLFGSRFKNAIEERQAIEKVPPHVLDFDGCFYAPAHYS